MKLLNWFKDRKKLIDELYEVKHSYLFELAYYKEENIRLIEENEMLKKKKYKGRPKGAKNKRKK